MLNRERYAGQYAHTNRLSRCGTPASRLAARGLRRLPVVPFTDYWLSTASRYTSIAVRPNTAECSAALSSAKTVRVASRTSG